MKQIFSLACLVVLTLGITRYAFTAHAQAQTVYFFTQGVLAVEEMQHLQEQLEHTAGVHQVALHDNDRAFKISLNPRHVSGKAIRQFISCAELHWGTTEACTLPNTSR